MKTRKLGRCQHEPWGSPRRAWYGTLMVNSAGTRQICAGCDWSRPLKKWEKAFRRWAKQQVPSALPDITARNAFEAGWHRRSA